jgi:protein-disulfide isomerase
MRLSLIITCLLATTVGSGAAIAQTPVCDRLTGAQQRLAAELLGSEHPYDCCDGTIAACLGQRPVCSLARRLADNVCRRVAEGQEADRIRRALSRRARSMLPSGPAAEIDLEGVPMAGDEDAPITVVVYACARCPFCSKLLPELHDAATGGSLVGKARLYFKLFPIRGHPHSREGGLAFMAAAEQGLFWEFTLHSYANFDDFCVDRLAQWAEAVGMDQEVFAARVADPATREALVESKKEGLRNRVEVTPTVFIDGRRYVGDLTLEELVDVIGEAYDTVQGSTHLDDMTGAP